MSEPTWENYPSHPYAAWLLDGLPSANYADHPNSNPEWTGRDWENYPFSGDVVLSPAATSALLTMLADGEFATSDWQA